MIKEGMVEKLKSKMALERCDPDTMPYFTDYYWIPKDEIANLAQEILKLFKAEVDKLTVIGNEEIQNIINEGVIKYSSLGVPRQRQAIDRDITQAQLQDCQKKLLEGLEG